MDRRDADTRSRVSGKQCVRSPFLRDVRRRGGRREEEAGRWPGWWSLVVAVAAGGW